MAFFVYLLECRDKSYYCGYTNNLKRRLEEHNSGKGGRYTSTHRPVRLIYSEEQETIQSAMAREREIKKYARWEKEKLVNGKSV